MFNKANIGDYNKKELLNAFLKVGIKKKDSLFITTNLGLLGVPQTNNKKFMLTSSKWLMENLRQIIGSQGNIFVPTYSYSFAKKKKFSPTKTRADIGYFPNFFLKHKGIARSSDPMMSIAGYGPNAKAILSKLPNTSFGKDCVFERLLKIKNLKCCNVGLGVNWIPFLHYLDWLNKVPFRFNKKFFGYTQIGRVIKKIEWNFFARYLRGETISNGYRIGRKALKKKLYKKTRIGKSVIYVINYKKFFYFSKKLTKNNKWLTVNGPKFKI